MSLLNYISEGLDDIIHAVLTETDAEVLNTLIKFSPVAIVAGVVIYALHNNKDKELCNIIRDVSSTIKDASPMNQTKDILEAFNNALEKKKGNKDK